ncbi:hypothetical protein LCGC14_1064650 [marine sediment metagenome]|uniref:Uncharacterized protein n=1 Tax=marine sediment metagenome TaxID=412755 RepID=A0A0F9Q306_9ZZZZ
MKIKMRIASAPLADRCLPPVVTDLTNVVRPLGCVRELGYYPGRDALVAAVAAAAVLERINTSVLEVYYEEN